MTMEMVCEIVFKDAYDFTVSNYLGTRVEVWVSDSKKGEQFASEMIFRILEANSELESYGLTQQQIKLLVDFFITERAIATTKYTFLTFSDGILVSFTEE